MAPTSKDSKPRFSTATLPSPYLKPDKYPLDIEDEGDLSSQQSPVQIQHALERLAGRGDGAGGEKGGGGLSHLGNLNLLEEGEGSFDFGISQSDLSLQVGEESVELEQDRDEEQDQGEEGMNERGKGKGKGKGKESILSSLSGSGGGGAFLGSMGKDDDSKKSRSAGVGAGSNTRQTSSLFTGGHYRRDPSGSMGKQGKEDHQESEGEEDVAEEDDDGGEEKSTIQEDSRTEGEDASKGSKRNGKSKSKEEGSSREKQLQHERDVLRALNRVLEEGLESLGRVGEKMEALPEVVSTSHEIMNLYVRQLSQTHHIQKLILEQGWEGTEKDIHYLQSIEAAAREREAREKQEAEERERAAAEARERERMERERERERERMEREGKARARGLPSHRSRSSLRRIAPPSTSTTSSRGTHSRTTSSYGSGLPPQTPANRATTTMGRGAPGTSRGTAPVTGVRGQRGLRSRVVSRVGGTGKGG